MADSVVSIILDTTDSGRQKRQKAITNVSAEATDGQLRSFAEAVNALTLNDLDKITRVEKKDITTAEPTPDYSFVGADKVYITYDSSGEVAKQFETYAVVDRNNKVVEASMSSSTIDPDTSTVVIDFYPSNMGYVWNLELEAKKNAAYEYEVVLTATSSLFSTLKKTIKVIMYENVGDE